MSQRLRGASAEIDFLRSLADPDATPEQREDNAQTHMYTIVDFLAERNVMVVSTALEILASLALDFPSVQVAALDTNAVDSIVPLPPACACDYELDSLNLIMSRFEDVGIYATAESAFHAFLRLIRYDIQDGHISATFEGGSLSSLSPHDEAYVLEACVIQMKCNALPSWRRSRSKVALAEAQLCYIIGPSAALRAAASEAGAIPVLVDCSGIMMSLEDAQAAAFETGVVPG
jgi:hypothetical protein